MSRILKRPMFRRGGSTNTGIMSGLVDRAKLQSGTNMIGNMTEDQFRTNLKNLINIQDQFVPLPKTRLPIGDVGFALATGADPIEALGIGYKKFVSEDDKRRALLDKRKSAAVSTVLGQALKEKKTTAPTTKAVKNISNQTLFNIPPGGEGFATNAQIIAAQGAFKTPDTRMITLPTGEVIPYEEYKKRNTKEEKAQGIGTEFNILNSLVGDMKNRAPDTPTSVLGVGYGIVEAGVDQFRQIGEDLGIKERLEIKDQGKIDEYLSKQGFTEKAENFATMRSSVISLAYALARIAEPNNPKYSEGDIIRQLDRINFGGSRNVFLASLNQILKEEGIRANATIKGLGFEDPTRFFDITGSVMDTSKASVSEATGNKTGSKKNNDPAGIR